MSGALAWRRGREPLSQAPAREGFEDLGEGVVQGRAQDGSEQAADAIGFREAAAPLGGRAYFRVDLAQPTHGQRLRATVLGGRGVHPRGYDTAHGEEACTSMSTQTPTPPGGPPPENNRRTRFASTVKATLSTMLISIQNRQPLSAQPLPPPPPNTMTPDSSRGSGCWPDRGWLSASLMGTMMARALSLSSCLIIVGRKMARSMHGSCTL